MIANHTISNISFDKEHIYLTVDGRTISVVLADISPKLYAARDFEREIYQISPSGYGIHWPLIDEDISVSAILTKLNS